MSKPEITSDHDAEDRHSDPKGGINLPLIYGLMLLALLAAIGFAALIVFPFYQRR